MELSDLFIGQIVIAFNANEWQKTGDIGNNSQFLQEAEILDLRTIKNATYPGESQVADVKFLKTGEISHGHFLNAIKRVKS